MSSPTAPRNRTLAAGPRSTGPRPGLARATVSAPGATSGPTAVSPVDDRVRALEEENQQLRAAMASRAIIEQAKGVLMLLTGCGEQAAFDLLTHISSHTHRKVREVAQELTASAAGQHPLPADVRAILRDACPPAAPH